MTLMKVSLGRCEASADVSIALMSWHDSRSMHVRISSKSMSIMLLQKNYSVTCVSFSLAGLVHFGILTSRWLVALESPRHHSLFVARFRL